MNIPQTILNVWKLRIKHGELATIAKTMGLARNTVANAINNGNCEKDTFLLIKKYFANKKKDEAKLVKETLKETPKSVMETKN